MQLEPPTNACFIYVNFSPDRITRWTPVHGLSRHLVPGRYAHPGDARHAIRRNTVDLPTVSRRPFVRKARSQRRWKTRRRSCAGSSRPRRSSCRDRPTSHRRTIPGGGRSSRKRPGSSRDEAARQRRTWTTVAYAPSAQVRSGTIGMFGSHRSQKDTRQPKATFLLCVDNHVAATFTPTIHRL